MGIISPWFQQYALFLFHRSRDALHHRTLSVHHINRYHYHWDSLVDRISTIQHLFHGHGILQPNLVFPPDLLGFHDASSQKTRCNLKIFYKIHMR